MGERNTADDVWLAQQLDIGDGLTSIYLQNYEGSVLPIYENPVALLRNVLPHVPKVATEAEQGLAPDFKLHHYPLFA